MEVSNQEMQSTYKSRMLWLQILLEEVKKNKKLLQDDLVKFGMNRWMMSRLIVERYIDDLVAAGKLKRQDENDSVYVEFIP
jgi:hypothetical protein